MYSSIPYMQIRGGSSKGIFFNKKDLPIDEKERNEIILSIVGRDKNQIDGLGGGNPLTSKVAIVSKSTKINCDIDYLFIQVVLGENKVDTSPNCGNILSGVGAFCIEEGLIKAQDKETCIVINMINSNTLCELIIQTPNKKLSFEGSASIDGVEGSSSPIICNYQNIAGSLCGSLFPTGKKIDVINGIEVTCIDNGMPVVLIKATSFGKTAYESCDELEQDLEFKKKLEKLRLEAGKMMNLGDVSSKVIPKMTLLSKAKNKGHINTRTFIPHACHSAIGVLGAVSVASACLFEQCITKDFVNTSKELVQKISVEHPSGEFSVELTCIEKNNELEITKAGLLRTARIISKGICYPHREILQ
ncbi:MAG: 4-oxalomesaconate tautomerase [Campylobacteraceae bacterium]|nr:4-oxalomesaconate tautomerase [Campylobacteraceae bacterium]